MSGAIPLFQRARKVAQIWPLRAAPAEPDSRTLRARALLAQLFTDIGFTLSARRARQGEMDRHEAFAAILRGLPETTGEPETTKRESQDG